MYRVRWAIIFLLFLVSIAYAWGPGTHIELSAYLFSNLSLLTPGLYRLLKKHVRSFFYGAMFADSIVGKRFARQVDRCHSWNMGMRLLSEASSRSQKAFAYGFLSHLASDVVAHNFFVPHELIASYKANTLGHFYWEMRFEFYLDDRVWEIANHFAKFPMHEHDELMNRVLKSMLLPFRASKKIFERLVIAQSLERWRILVNRMSERSAFTLSREDFDRYLFLSLDATIDFLKNREKSWIISFDPLGVDAIKAAQSIKRGLRKLRRFNAIDNGFISNLFEQLRLPKPKYSKFEKPRWDELLKSLELR